MKSEKTSEQLLGFIANGRKKIQQLEAELKASRSSERESFEKSQTHIKNQEDLIDTILNQRTSDKENILNLNGQISELKEELRKRDQEVERLKQLVKGAWVAGRNFERSDGVSNNYKEFSELNNL